MWFEKKYPISQLGIVSDHHCHLLPGVDDGVQTPEESLAILRAMSAFGIRQVVLTPHLNPDVYPEGNEASMRQRYEWFTAWLQAQAEASTIDPLPTLTLGAEYMVTAGFEQRDAQELLQFQPQRVLIEMSYMYPSDNIEQSVFHLTSSGLIPVIAHPERYLYWAGHLESFERLSDMGCEFQLNLLSLSGAYGRGSLRIIDYLLAHNYYTCVGSDTHTLQHFQNITNIKLKKRYKDAIQRFTAAI